MRISACLIAAFVAAPAWASVGVSVSVGDPGFYGRIDIGDAPRPVLVYPEPIVVTRGPSVGPPIYMRVPPGHAKHWEQHCADYGACGHPVFFVQDDWYEDVYVPHYQERHGHGQGHGNGKGHGKGKGKGKGHGHGHD